MEENESIPKNKRKRILGNERGGEESSKKLFPNNPKNVEGEFLPHNLPLIGHTLNAHSPKKRENEVLEKDQDSIETPNKQHKANEVQNQMAKQLPKRTRKGEF